MFFASWLVIIEAGEKFKYRSGCIHEWWKTWRKIGCLIRQGKRCDALFLYHFASFSRVKTGVVEKGKTLGVPVDICLHPYQWSWISGNDQKMRAYETRILRKTEKVTMFDEEITQLRWFGHISRMSQKWLPKQTLYATVNGKSQIDDRGQDGLIISRILVGIVWDFVQANAVCVGGLRIALA